MKKIMIWALCTILATGCSIETISPENNEEVEEPEAVENVVQFEPRDIETSYVVIVLERLNVRSDANIDSGRVGQVREDETFMILEEKYDSQKRVWYKIQTSDGAKGYVAGWYCAKTNITIHVTADDAIVKNIETEPVPTYLDNPFEENSAKVGDQIVGFVINEISMVEEEKKIVFDGQTTLTGSFYHENSDLSFGRVVRFVPDEASSVLLPRIEPELNSTWFVLEDYDQVANQFGEVGTTGDGTIVIENYSIGYGGAGSYNQAKLVSFDYD